MAARQEQHRDGLCYLGDFQGAQSVHGQQGAASTRRGAYPAGLEANGTDSKPTLASLDDFPTSRFQYRPSATSAVTVATTSSLSGSNWWSTPPTWGDDYFDWDEGGGGLQPSNFKGALDPNGSTITVGVLNP